MTTQHTDPIEREVEGFETAFALWLQEWRSGTPGEAMFAQQFIKDWLRTSLTRIQQETEERVREEILCWAKKKHDEYADSMTTAEDRSCAVLAEIITTFSENNEGD
jgi:hypothetical protein